ncbi:EexN family lipoprotein [Enterobacter kobei]|uniref:EexN family lipoprotein n=1 Tax=Enterobacter kobei TaxID=208224 RepID=UPI00388D019A
MKTTLKVALVFIGVSALAGCKPEHDKDWYKSHETERKQMLVECKRTLNSCRMLDCKMQETQRLNFLFMGKITLIACRS